MVKVDFNCLENINQEEIIRKLRRFKGEGYRWQRCGFLGEDCRIFAPNFMIEIEELVKILESSKLAIGNKEQIQLIDAATIAGLVYRNDCPTSYCDSSNIN